jgi:hypothetical protein
VAVQTPNDRRGAERRRHYRLTFPERRTGFERRRPASGTIRAGYHRTLEAYRKNPRTLVLVLAMFNLLNLADLMLTYRSLIVGATEVNPIMKALFDIHPVWAGMVKMSVGMIVSEAIWALRRYRSALVLSIGITVGMALLFAYHLFIGQSLPL